MHSLVKHFVSRAVSYGYNVFDKSVGSQHIKVHHYYYFDIKAAFFAEIGLLSITIQRV